MIKYFADNLKAGQVRYDPKRNMNTELKYFELLPWQPRSYPGMNNVLLLAVAKNSDEHYIAIRDTLTKKEYIEKVLLTVSGDDIKMDPIQINDYTEWISAMEFFVKMGIIQNKNSRWRWSR